MIKNKLQSTIIALNKREFDGKFIVEKVEKKILPQILFIVFPSVGLLHFYKVQSSLQKTYQSYFSYGETTVALLIVLPFTKKYYCLWLCGLSCRRWRNQKIKAGLFSLRYVSSSRMVANLTAAVFTCQRWGIFACINNCTGSLSNSHKLNPAASVTTFCLPFHPLTLHN